MVATGAECVSLSDMEINDTSEDETSLRASGRQTAIDHGSKAGRKRAATTHDPKKETSRVKMTHPIQALHTQMSEVVDALKGQVTVIEAHERWLDEALELWRKEFQGTSFPVQRAVHKIWSQNPSEAQMFAQSSREYRRWFVNQTREELGLEDTEGHVSSAAGEEEYTDI